MNNNDNLVNVIITKNTNKLDYIIDSNYDTNRIFDSSSDENLVLITGQVQSGKTNQIIEIIKKAIDNHDFNIILVIGGYTKNLLSQTQKRLEKELHNRDSSVIKSNYFNFKVVEWNNEIEQLESNRIYNILKNPIYLNDFCEKLKNNNLKKIKALIIDDECDFFSVNTNKKYRNNEESNYDEEKRTFQCLKEIYKTINNYNNNSLFISVTATPYANLFTNNDNEFKIQSVYSLPINDDYYGLEYFVNNVDEHFIVDDIFLKNHEEDNVINVIIFWLMQTTLYFQKTQNNKSELIIFNSINKKEHQKIEKIIKDNFIQNNKNKFKYNFENLKNKYIELFWNLNWTNFEHIIDKLINNIDKALIVLNSDYCNKNNSNKNNKEELKIYIGGSMLSRGITFKNLLVQYFTYISPQWTQDTLLQRCRWFGYRNNNDLIDYMKIITTTNHISYMKKCIDSIDIFFNNKTTKGAKFNIEIILKKLENIENKNLTSNSKRN